VTELSEGVRGGGSGNLPLEEGDLLNKLCLFRTKTNEIVIHTSQFERNMKKGFSASDGAGRGQEESKLNVDEIK
jgi:hypothetical protein